MVGLTRWRWSTPTAGLKITANTAANVSGSTISLTAPNAPTTMIVAATTPTKLQAKTPTLGTHLSGAGTPLALVLWAAAAPGRPASSDSSGMINSSEHTNRPPCQSVLRMVHLAVGTPSRVEQQVARDAAEPGRECQETIPMLPG